MSVEIKWIGHASFRIALLPGPGNAGTGCVLYIDPWKLPDAPHDADVVFISHSHFDHFSPPDVQKVSKPDTAVVAPGDVIGKLHAASAVKPDDRLTFKDVTIEAVAAYNVNKAFHPRGNDWCGGVFTLGGQRIYYAGDTDLIPEMAKLADIDVALLPIGGTYTLNAAEAARACKSIGCKAVIPYHWGDIIGTADDADRFAKAAPCKVHLLRPGQAVSV